MTLLNLTRAIDIALEFLGATKLCYAAGDKDAYYLTACSDDGEPINAECCCRVDKKTGEARICRHDDPCWDGEIEELPFPDERKDCYIPFEKIIGLE